MLRRALFVCLLGLSAAGAGACHHAGSPSSTTLRSGPIREERDPASTEVDSIGAVPDQGSSDVMGSSEDSSAEIDMDDGDSSHPGGKSKASAGSGDKADSADHDGDGDDDGGNDSGAAVGRRGNGGDDGGDDGDDDDGDDGEDAAASAPAPVR